MATYSNNTTLKVLQAATSGYVIPSDAYAVCEYRVGTLPHAGEAYAPTAVFTRHFGPGQTIPASLTYVVARSTDPAGLTYTATYSFVGGVVFQNSP